MIRHAAHLVAEAVVAALVLASGWLRNAIELLGALGIFFLVGSLALIFGAGLGRALLICLAVFLPALAYYVFATHYYGRLVHLRWRLLTRRLQRTIDRGRRPRDRLLLYLRPFDADFARDSVAPHAGEVIFYDSGRPIIMDYEGRRPSHVEDWLRTVLLPHGRMIGLANPEEREARESPFRLVTSAEAWRDTVTSLMQCATLVVCVLPLAVEETMGEGQHWVKSGRANVPRFSRTGQYEGFYDEIGAITRMGLAGKLLLVIPAWDAPVVEAEWLALRARLGAAGLSLPASPEDPIAHRKCGLGLFLFRDDGRYRMHGWKAELPFQSDWLYGAWSKDARMLSRCMGRPVSWRRRMLASAEHYPLIGPSAHDMLNLSIREQKRMKALEGGDAA